MGEFLFRHESLSIKCLEPIMVQGEPFKPPESSVLPNIARQRRVAVDPDIHKHDISCPGFHTLRHRVEVQPSMGVMKEESTGS